MLTRSRQCFLVTLLAMAFLISGCMPIALLKNDRLKEGNGLMILRLRVKDTSRKLSKAVPEFYVGKLYSNFVTPIFMTPLEGKWQAERTAEADHYDQYYFIEGEPGRYLISTMILEYNLAPKTTLVYPLPLQIAFDLKKNGLVVAGTLDVVVDSLTDNKIDFRSALNRTDTDIAEIMTMFRIRYPKLSRTYQNAASIDKTFFGLYEDFTLSGVHGRWDSFRSDTFSANNYNTLALTSRHADKKKHGYAGMKNPLNLPANYEIRYKIRWNEGMRDALYGLRLAKDASTVYYFGITADGTTTVWIKKDGAWLADPPVKNPAQFFASKKKADEFSVKMLNGRIVFTINNETAASFDETLNIKNALVSFFTSGTQNIEIVSIEIFENNLKESSI